MTSSSDKKSIPLHHPYEDDKFYHKFLFNYFPVIFEVGLFIVVYILIFVVIIIVSTKFEYEQLSSSPPQRDSKIVNSNWDFPIFSFCIGKDSSHAITTSSSCITKNILNGDIIENNNCQLEIIGFPFKVFNDYDNLNDECYTLKVNDNNYQTNYFTVFKFTQKVTLQKTPTNPNDQIPEILFKLPTSIRGSIYHKESNPISLDNFKEFPSTTKLSFQIYEQIIDQTRSIGIVNKISQKSIWDEVCKIYDNYLIAKPIFFIPCLLHKREEPQSPFYLYNYDIYSSNIGKFGNSAICVPNLDNTEVCTSYFEVEIKVKPDSNNEYLMTHSTFTSFNIWFMLISSFGGKLAIGQSIVALLMLIFPATIFRYCFKKREQRESDVEFYEQYLRLSKPSKKDIKNSKEIELLRQHFLEDFEDENDTVYL